MGKLVHDFRCIEPEKMNYKTLSGRTRYLKSDEEALTKMRDASEEIREEGRIEGLALFAIQALSNGKLTAEDVAELLEIPAESVLESSKKAAV